MNALFRFGYAVAVLLVCAAVALWVIPAATSDRLTAPFKCPFPIVPGGRATLSFIPRLAEKHYIGIELDRNLPADRLKHIIGFPPAESTLRPKIEFRLDANGERVATSLSTGSWSSRSVGLDLASFRPTPGVQYALSASVRDAEPDLRSLNGRLVVTVESLTGERYYYGVLFARFFAIVAFVVAAFVARMSYFAIRVRRAMLTPQTT